MSILVSSTEPKTFHTLGTLTTIPEKFGCDFLLSTPTQTIGIQRKKFPDDLLSSLPPSNRLSDQLQKMQTLTQKLIILEGRAKYTSDGKLMKQHGRQYTRGQIHTIIIALQISHGIPVIHTENEEDTKEVIERFFNWGQKVSHGSLLRHVGPANNSSIEAYRLALLQTLPQIGLKKAQDILAHFGGLPMILTKDLTEVRGVGKETNELVKAVFNGEKNN